MLPHRVENDHREPFAKTRHTRLDELHPLCEHHHDLKTLKSWALTEGSGKRPIVPPHDPRHPKNKPKRRCGEGILEWAAGMSFWRSGENDELNVRHPA
ncbi:MAG: hypothetical protein JOZ99_10270 [Actinobacteria bacterium]|nr:hypothetical protein [Actinomycetota bacterium]